MKWLEPLIQRVYEVSGNCRVSLGSFPDLLQEKLASFPDPYQNFWMEPEAKEKVGS